MFQGQSSSSRRKDAEMDDLNTSMMPVAAYLARIIAGYQTLDFANRDT
jgi:hypothetical protein